MRDRLRTVECLSDVVDQIGGWSCSSLGQNYGAGYHQHKGLDWYCSALQGACMDA
jgi:hypothetical protein